MNNTPYLLALHSIDGLGPIRLKAVLNYFKDPKIAWEAEGVEFQKIGIPRNTVEILLEIRRNLDPLEYAKSIEDSGIKWMSVFDEEYPKSLSLIYDPPTVIYFKGEILPIDEQAIAVVGTRKITGYGTVVTKQFVRGLVSAGLTIVSGLARGVDSVAHQTTLESGGRTLAILGGGLNRIFPPENISLAKKISEGHGAVISEFPPDYPSLPGNFPSRNRIISGLSRAVLVTEAASDSGSLITARVALEQGRDVYAVPGPITSDLSMGPIDLIKEGARPVTSATEILEDLGLTRIMNNESRIMDRTKLSENENKILDCLDNENRHIDELCRLLHLTAAEVSANLLKMEMAGIVISLGSGNYCKSER